jgi:hypothetical protein
MWWSIIQSSTPQVNTPRMPPPSSTKAVCLNRSLIIQEAKLVQIFD